MTPALPIDTLPLAPQETSTSIPPDLLDDIIHLAATLCQMPVAAISLGDKTGQTLQASTGLQKSEIPSHDALYTHTLASPDNLLVVPNLPADGRFAGSAFTNKNLRFYAGVSFRSADGRISGILFVMDKQARELLGKQSAGLHRLASQAQFLIETHNTRAILSKRTAELEIITRVSSLVSSEAETSALLQEILDYTKDNFFLYHVQIYEMNEGQDTLLLTVGAGEIGQQLRERGHRIPVRDQQSLVARAARTRFPIIENDLRQAPNFLPNPLLPHSQASLALPMIISNQVLGVLNVQANRAGYFTDEDVRIQTTLATQIGAALQTARSLEASEEALRELNALTRRLTHEGWDEYISQTKADFRMAYDAQQLKAVTPMDLSGTVEGLSTQLTIQGASIGQLNLSEPQLMEDEAAEIMATVAAHLSTHIENLRLSEQTEQVLVNLERYSERLSLLNEMATRLSTDSSVEGVYKTAANYAKRVFQSERASVTVLRPEDRTFEILVIDGESGELETGRVLPLNGTAVWDAIKSKRILQVDVDSSTNTEAPILQKQGLKTAMVAPLIVRDDPIGTFNVGSVLPHAFGANEEALMLQMTSLLANAIDSQQLTDQIQRQLADLTTIQTTTARLAGTVDLDSAIESLLPLMSDALNADLVTLFVVNEGQLSRLAVYPNPAELPLKEEWLNLAHYPFLSQVVESKSAQIANFNEPTLSQQITSQLAQLNINATIAVPVLRQNRVWGIMGIISHQPGRKFSRADLTLAQTLADQASIAFERTDLFQQTQVSLAQTAEQARRLALLNELADELSRAENFDRIVNVSVHKAQQIFSANRASLARIEPDRQTYRILALGGKEGNITIGKLMSLKNSAIGSAMEKRRVITVNQSRDANLPGIKSFMVSPIIVADVVINTLNIGRETANGFSSTDENLSLQITSLIAATLENRRLLEETQRLFSREQGRARREQLLREITAKVRSSTDPDVIMRTAVRELSHALGRESFVYLGEPDSQEKSI